MRKSLGACLGVIVLLFVANCTHPFVWYSPAIEGRITDSVSGKPIAGAVVLMTWETRGSQGMTTGLVAAEESVSNDAGGFRIPSWGPRISFIGTVRYGEPITRVLHPAHLPLDFRNTGPTEFTPAPWSHDPRFVGIKYERDKNIKLAPAAPSPEERVLALIAFSSTMSFAYFGKECEWTHAQRTLSLLDQMRSELAASSNSNRLDEVLPFKTVRANGGCENKTN